jgi:hypothetical protein
MPLSSTVYNRCRDGSAVSPGVTAISTAGTDRVDFNRPAGTTLGLIGSMYALGVSSVSMILGDPLVYGY